MHKLLNPESAELAEWSTPQVKMLAAAHDSLLRTYLMAHGVDVENLPPHGLWYAIVSFFTEEDTDSPGEKETEKKKTPPRLKTSADIRAAVRATEKQ